MTSAHADQPTAQTDKRMSPSVKQEAQTRVQCPCNRVTITRDEVPGSRKCVLRWQSVAWHPEPSRGALKGMSAGPGQVRQAFRTRRGGSDGDVKQGQGG